MFELRGILHRIAAVVLVGASVIISITSSLFPVAKSSSGISSRAGRISLMPSRGSVQPGFGKGKTPVRPVQLRREERILGAGVGTASWA